MPANLLPCPTPIISSPSWLDASSPHSTSSPILTLFAILLLCIGSGCSGEAASQPDLRTGVLYKNDRVRTVPWSIHVLRIDRKRPDFRLTTTLADNEIIGVQTLSEQLESIPPALGRPVAAVNGGFYRTDQEPLTGDPRGLQIWNGELVSSPDGDAAFWLDPKGQPHIDEVTARFRVTWPDGSTTPFELNEERPPNAAVLFTPRFASTTQMFGGNELILVRDGDSPWLPLQAGKIYSARVRDVRRNGNSRIQRDTLVLSLGHNLANRYSHIAPGTILKLSTATTPDLAGVTIALGAGPRLVQNGAAERISSYKSNNRHPRTAFGWNENYFFFVAVDGRQPGLSIGMTLPELANYLVKQGCQEALNLDGGGSVEMWIDGSIVNRPCYGYERPTANSLVLLHNPTPPSLSKSPSQQPETPSP